MEEDAKNNRIEVTEDNVADVVSDDWIPWILNKQKAIN
jgi:hypothetical protein